MSWLLDLLFPPRANCLGCGDPLGADGEFLCDACEALLVPEHDRHKARCLRCGSPSKALAPCPICALWPENSVDWARYVYPYRRPLDRMIQRMKYSGVTMLAPWMAEQMHRLIVAEALALPDVLVPVSMHSRRLRRRGFNHAERLAAELSVRIDRPMATALVRTRNTRQQARLSREQRRHNLSGAFSAGHALAGKRVLLIDDVRTSGATACECAAALRRAGASEIGLLTLCGTAR